MRQVKIFAGSSHPELANLISERLGHPLAPLVSKKFSNGETGVEVAASVRDEDVFIIQSGSGKVNDNLMELLILVNACKTASARRITVIVPYYPYSKQSKKKQQRGAITAKLIANMLNVAGADHFITMDLHASQMQGFFQKPIDNLFAEPSITKWIKDRVPDYRSGVVVAKNAGGAKRVTSLADSLDLDFAIIHNDGQGFLPGEKEEGITLVGEVENKVAFLVDDMCDKVGSFIQAAEYLMKIGKAQRVIIIATHGILSGDALPSIECCESIHQVVVTNTYPIPEEKRRMSSKLVIIDISGTFAEAIRRTHNGESISYLFKTPL